MREYITADCTESGPDASPGLVPSSPLTPDRSPSPAPGSETAASNPTNPCSSINPDSSLPDSQPAFPRSPGETPRAYTAFMVFFQLGAARSLKAVADNLGENLGTVKNWSSRFDWSGRIHAFNSGLLHQQAQAAAATLARHSADWAARLQRFREQEWDAAQKLLAAAQCFLECFGDEDLHKMSLAQVSRALRISSDLGRHALAGADIAKSLDPALSPAQQQLLDAMKRVYGAERTSAAAPAPEAKASSQSSTLPHP